MSRVTAARGARAERPKEPVPLIASISARIDQRLAHLVNDRRDVPFVRLSAAAALTVMPFAAALFLPGVFRWWLALAYGVVNFMFLDRFILMLHNTSHRALYKPRYRWMNAIIPWVLGPFFGETPETYYAHHLGMHHPENNLPADLSSTMRYQRDSVLHFLVYFARFLVIGLAELATYLTRKNRSKLRRRMLSGEVAFMVLVTGLMFVSWQATLVVFVAPVLIVRFLMMAGNWGQHAFVCESDPGSAYKNSITVIRCRYNERCFNDGYHIGHHLKSNRHWSELPGEFEANRAEYAKHDAIVFEGIDFFGVWALLMLGRHAALARRYVHHEGTRPSDDEIVALLKRRLRAIPERSSATAPAVA